MFYFPFLEQQKKVKRMPVNWFIVSIYNVQMNKCREKYMNSLIKKDKLRKNMKSSRRKILKQKIMNASFCISMSFN